jgi:hypothetical protein
LVRLRSAFLEETPMVTRATSPLLDAALGERFFASHRWPVLLILVCVALSVLAFTPRLLDYLSAGHWGQAATHAAELTPRALDAHALFGMLLLPLLLVQPVLGAVLPGSDARGGLRGQGHGVRSSLLPFLS